MTTSMLACGKANAYGSLRSAVVASTRQYTTGPVPSGSGKHSSRNEDAALQRELFVNVLNANATKRDAKQYLARFKPSDKPKPGKQQDERNARHRQDQDRLERSGVNLGGLYTPARAIADSPQFTQHLINQRKPKEVVEPQLHVALVCLRDAEAVDDITLDGLAVTLSQLVRLDMMIILVLDSSADNPTGNGHHRPKDVRDMRALFAQQASRISQAIERHSAHGGRFVPGTLEQVEQDPSHDVDDQATPLEVSLPRLIFDPLRRSVVPIIPSLAYSPTGKLVRASSVDVMTALAKRLAKCTDSTASSNHFHKTDETATLDRVIILDVIGGIPSKDRGDGAHVFINLEQEFDHIADELHEYAASAREDAINAVKYPVYEQHLKNLEMTHKCLRVLPAASSALIITPHEAATSARAGRTQDSTLGAGTRRQRNTLIHNMLTNKPLVSSSLPTARFHASKGSPDVNSNEDRTLLAATLVKRGMPVEIIPAAERLLGWQRSINGISTLDLERDSRIDFARLLHLIENSFRRKLDVRDYLSRIENRIAGIIVAGDYEGGAILTWEMPPGVDDPSRMVPYLDKFAVLQSSQGSSGVADIVFQAMVRTCFPLGVCWRSRQDNPVNKWYFERSAGSWQIPGSNWTMFWTGEGVVGNQQRWDDYVGVCSSVKPSWADGKKPD